MLQGSLQGVLFACETLGDIAWCSGFWLFRSSGLMLLL